MTAKESQTEKRIYLTPRVPSEKDQPHARMWGFADSYFEVVGGTIRLNSRRYASGGAPLENFAPFVQKAIGVPFDSKDIHPLVDAVVPPALPCAELMAALLDALGAGAVSTKDEVRLRHGHGHHLEEIYHVLYGKLERVPDVVVYPSSEEEVRAVLDVAARFSALVVPFGGGTCVSMALASPDGARPIISLDMSKMDRVEWIDPVTKTASIQGGAVGRILEEELRQHGFTLGHEPDSIEFSTLGGWIATNASGMKKNRYGNIENIVLDVSVVTRAGVVTHPGDGARVSHGLDVRRLAIGSEGMLGVITRAVVKIHRAPEVQRYGSLVFPDWSAGVAFMEELSNFQAAPASVRLVDNMQFQFGRALKPSNKSPLLSELQKLFVTKIHGVDLEKMVACTLVYEGEDEEQRELEARVMRTAKKFGGFGAGGAAGKDGYNLTFGIAYIRDFLLQYWTLGDSFETAVPWGKVDAVVDGVKAAVARSHEESGLAGHPFVTARVSQIYQTGCCVYFYIGFHYKECKDPLEAFRRLEHDARVAILDAGGALSHHHGIGKIRAEYLDRVKSPAALEWNRRAQAALDPDGIFSNGNQNIRR
jgi:alkyldihydroxyacetonephosphate synthase